MSIQTAVVIDGRCIICGAEASTLDLKCFSCGVDFGQIYNAGKKITLGEARKIAFENANRIQIEESNLRKEQKQTCEEEVVKQMQQWRAFYRTNFPGGDDVLTLTMLKMAKRIDELSAENEILMKRLEILERDKLY